jgi:hypothetical protein
LKFSISARATSAGLQNSDADRREQKCLSPSSSDESDMRKIMYLSLHSLEWKGAYHIGYFRGHFGGSFMRLEAPASRQPRHVGPAASSSERATSGRLDLPSVRWCHRVSQHWCPSDARLDFASAASRCSTGNTPECTNGAEPILVAENSRRQGVHRTEDNLASCKDVAKIRATGILVDLDDSPQHN